MAGFATLPAMPAQEAASAEPETGSVAGHVICSDTRQPCRFATVLLQSAEPVKYKGSSIDNMSYTGTTDLGGEFSIGNVLPGKYLAYGLKSGYLSVYDLIPNTQLQAGTATMNEKLQAAGEPVLVTANQMAVVQLLLQRGGALNGTVRYDDGSPAGQLAVRVLRKEDDQWKAVEGGTIIFQTLGTSLTTDDRGRFRIAGLPAGEYSLEVILPRQVAQPSGLLGRQSMGVQIAAGGALSTFYGNTLHRKNAKAIQLKDDDELDGLDLVISSVDLRVLSGRLIAKVDERPLTSTDVELLDPDDRSTVRRTATDIDGRFGFVAIPDGTYLLRISRVTDATTKSYATSERTVVVTADIRDLVVTTTAGAAVEAAK